MDELGHAQVDEFPYAAIRDGVLDDFFVRLERVEVIETERLHGDLDEFLVADARRALLLFEEVSPGIQHCVERNQADKLRARYADAPRLCGFAASIERDVDGRHGDVGEVQRYLSDAVLFDVPTDTLNGLARSGNPYFVAARVLGDRSGQRIALSLLAPLFANVEGDGVGPTRGRGVKVYVVCNEKVASADRRSARPGVEGGWTEVRFPFRFLEPLCETFIFTGSHDGEVATLIRLGRMLVAIDRQPDFFAESAGELAGVGHRLGHGDVRDGYERADVHRAEARMLPAVLAHVDAFCCDASPPYRGFDDLVGWAHKRHDCTIRRLAGIDVKKFDAVDGFHGAGDLLDDVEVTTFAEVRDTLDQLVVHGRHISVAPAPCLRV